ncbi:hypothetical protein TNCV_4535641 [Trichonephila clavipes]|nr:hypothetical protein TNCV_4535641 [Trichonephila clavipes]
MAIAKYPQHDFVFVYTDGSSDETFLDGGSGVFMTTSSLQELDKVCFLQWLPARVDIVGNESAERLTKEARNLNNDNFVNITLSDANAVANFKLINSCKASNP